MQLQKHKSELEEAHDSSVHSNTTIKMVLDQSLIRLKLTLQIYLKKQQQQHRKH